MTTPDAPDSGALTTHTGTDAIEPEQAPSPPPLPPLPRLDRYHAVTPWSPWGGLGATVLIAVLVVAFLVAVGGIAVAIYPDVVDRAAAPLVKLRIEQPTIAYAFAATMLASQLLGVTLTLLFARGYGGRISQTLALRPPIAGPVAYAWAIPAFVVFGFGLGAVVQLLWPQSNHADTQPMMQLARSPSAWLIFVVAVVGAPLQEELAFRGFLFSALAQSRRLGFAGAAVITSIGWASIHGYSITGDATIFCLGLFLSFILWRSGSTRVTMACHGTYNALAFLAAMLTTGSAS